MVDYSEKEGEVLEKIAKTLNKLDDTLNQIDESEGSKRDREQNKAIREIRKAISEGELLNDLEFMEAADDDNAPRANSQNQAPTLAQIDKTLAKLEQDLAALDETDSRVRGYIEQHKALHQVKKLLFEAGKYSAYRDE